MKSNSNKYKSKKRPQSSKDKSKMYLNQPKVLSSYKKEDSISFFPKDINSPNHVSSQFPSLDKNNRSKSAINDSNDFKGDVLNEEYAIIQKVWEDLGVTYKYRVQFDNYIKTVSESSLKNIFHNEKKNLARFKDSLVKLSKEITSRENNIRALKKYIFSLLNSINYFENEEDEKQRKNKESIILDIVGIIKSLRLNSVNVITHFLKVREISTYYTLVKKIDMKTISEDYNYDENYLRKMKDDMAFLKECQGLQKYFVMNNGEIDAFLTNFAPRSNSNESYSKINSNKVKIPVSEELNKFINQCRYILIQETFFDNMRDGVSQIDFRRGESNDINDYNVNNNNNSFILNKSNISKNNNKNNVSFRLKSGSPHNSKIQFFKDNENLNNAENKEISKLFMNDKQDNNMMGKNLEYLRKKMGKEYNNLFLSNQDKNLILKNKNYNNNIFPYNDMNKENLFRKPVIGNQILIEREEKREKTKSDFKLQNSFLRQKENPLSKQIEELNKELNEVCYENEALKKEIDDLKKYVKSLREKSQKENDEKEEKIFKINLKIEKMIKEYELKIKDLEQKIENLIKEKENLNQEIEKNKKLMEQLEEENKKKIDEINNLMQKQKADFEKVIEEKNNKIKELTDLRDDLIREKNEIIKQKEQIISERDQLFDDKNNMEEKINNMDTEIGKLNKEIENWKNDYNNLDLKENDMEKKIKELNGVIEDKDEEKKKIINEMNDKIEQLNNEISEWQFKIKNSEDLIDSMKNEIATMIKEKDALVNEKKNLEEKITTISNENSNVKGDVQNLTQKKNELERKINNLNQERNQLNSDINDLKNKIDDLTQENIKLKNEIEKLKENQKENKESQNANIKEVIKDNVIKESNDTCLIKGDYKYDFYRDNLYNLTQVLERSLRLDEIPDFIKLSFDLNNINIYEDSTYIKGVYPKIIVTTLKDSGSIAGICSVYYENYGQMDEPLILRIGALCVTEKHWDEKIETIINYIKDKIDFDELKIVIKYMPSPEHENKLRLNDKIKKVFKEKLNCIWKNLTNLSDGSRSQDVRFIKKGEYFNQDESTNINTMNSELFEFNTLSILSLFDNDNLSDFKQKFSSIGLNEYINLFPIFVLLANNPTYTMFFTNENNKNEYELPEEEDPEQNKGIENPKSQIRKISKMSMNLDDISKLKEIISSLEYSRIFDIDDSLCEEINNKLKSQINNFSFNYFSMNLNLSTTTNYCLEYDNYFYNRISSKNIDIFRDQETKNYFYLIPTRTESTFILICQLSKPLKQDLLDGHKNIYQAFMQYHPRLTNQLLKFSSIFLGVQQIKEKEKVIFIPSFKIDTHLFSESLNDINKMGNITNNKTGASGCVGSIDEYFRMSFEVDKNISNGFTIVPAEDGKTEVIINDSFLFAVFNTNIISSSPLQLFYVTKDHWIKSK